MESGLHRSVTGGVVMVKDSSPTISTFALLQDFQWELVDSPLTVAGISAACDPAEALAPEASQATVTMVTVEAETRRVNVSADPEKPTSFPHLERNSIDAALVPDMIPERVGSSGTDNSNSRKSIVGGDRERAEVLAAVRKGILKRELSVETIA